MAPVHCPGTWPHTRPTTALNVPRTAHHGSLFERAEGPEGIKALEVVADNPDDYSKKVKDAVIMALSTWRDIEKLKPQFAGLMELAKEKKAYTKSTLKTMRHQVLLSNLFELIKIGISFSE